MALKHVLLGLLVDQPDHGYRLKHRLSPGLPRERLINDGVLYPLLARLEREGLIAGRDETRGGRERRVFRATAAGRRELARWLRSDEDEEAGPRYDSYAAHPLVKLLFAGHLSAEQRRGKLERHATQVRERLELLERMRDGLPQAGGDELNQAWLELELAEARQRLAALEEVLSGRG